MHGYVGKPGTVNAPVRRCGSIIGCQNQSLGEAVAIVGTPFRLHYQSDRMPGRADAQRVAVTHAQGLSGWSFDVHHAYDPGTNALFLGDGQTRSEETLKSPIQTPTGDFLIAAEAGNEVYVFDRTGGHLRTVNALTSAIHFQFSYDAAGRLIRITDGDGNVTTVERDGLSNPTAIVAPFGQRTTLNRDANNFLSRITNPAGEAVGLAYTFDGLLTSFTDPRGNVHNFTYDAEGRLTRADDPASGFKTLARTDSARGWNLDLTTALGRTNSYQVANPAEGGERRLNTFPSSLQSEWVKDADETRTTSFPDGTGGTLALSPDPRWGMQAPVRQSQNTTLPSGLSSNVASTRAVVLGDPNDLFSLTRQTDTVRINGRTHTGTYTAATRTFTSSTPEGRQVTTTLDAQGRVVKEETPGLLPITYVYDTRGRLSGITRGTSVDARTTNFAYNTTGYLETTTDPVGRTVAFEYDGAGRMVRTTLPGSRTIGYAYDLNGNTTGITPPGRPAHNFTYSAVDLVSAYVPPVVGAGGNQTVYTYNADRQTTNVTRPDGRAISYTYDSAGRIGAVTTSRGILTYAYDPTTGKMLATQDPGGIGLAYDYDGALPTSTTWSGPIAGKVTRGYDADFRTSSVSVNDADMITLQYDNDGLLTRAGDLLLSRNPQNGLLTGTSLGSVSDNLSYNGFREVTNYRASTATDLFVVQYTRDKLGRITQKRETIGGNTDVLDYGYDVAGRLIEVRKNSTSIATYTYDSNGNRLSYTGASGTQTGTYDNQDRLTQYGTTTFTYTANGELASRSEGNRITTYQYDESGNLIRVGLPDSTQIEYLVDGQNRRVGKKINGIVVQGFLYDDQLRPVVELDGANSVVARFVYASRINVPEYLVKGGATYRIIADHLGSPRMVVNVATGEIVQRMDYDAFGNVTTNTNPGFQPFGFAGGLYDRDTTLVRFGARDYDPATGRWTAKDPIRFGGGDANLYAYVGSDPINLVDVSGLEIQYIGWSSSLISFGRAYYFGWGLVTDGSGGLAVYVTTGAGGGVAFSTAPPTAGGGVSVGGGTTANVAGMAGPFFNASAGVALEGKYSIDYYQDPSNSESRGGGITVGIGVGAGAYGIVTNTWLPYVGKVPMVADDVYDWFHPEERPTFIPQEWLSNFQCR